MANSVLGTRNYARITGIALAAIALLGTVWMFVGKEDTANAKDSYALAKGLLAFDWTHNILHWVLAAVALGVGYGNLGANVTRRYAQAFGVVYLALGIFGFAMPAGLKPLGLYLELGENLVHVLIGVWGVAAGFLGTTTAPTARPASGSPGAR